MIHFKKHKANILVLTVLSMAIIMMLFGVIIDLGQSYLTKAKIQTIADHSASAGATVVGDMILKAAENNLVSDPSLQNIENSLLLITKDDIEDIVSDKSRVTDEVKKYISLNSQSNHLQVENYEIIYPYDYYQGNSKIMTKVIIKKDQNFFFAKLLNKNKITITAEAISSMPIK
ncbi:hypothetical protein A2263_05625 [Candidatus Peregrinibacteria bacterium RIFOXYA2_FULL_33_21]|nr:MAG: hypothetical protein A2263_05625 [Candidatus Peregrinibacteria bacterium RIFOXYA2_FULL_33_21]